MIGNDLRTHRCGLLPAFPSDGNRRFRSPALSATLEAEATFSLNVEAKHLSLAADRSSLEMILTRLSEAIDIPITALRDTRKQITITFRDLPLKDDAATVKASGLDSWPANRTN